MESYEFSSKSVQPMMASSNTDSQRMRCSLCDSLLKTSHYLFIGKSIHENMKVDCTQSVTYAECIKKYFDDYNQIDQMNLICSNCSEHLKCIHVCNLQVEELTKKMREKLRKTKRLKRLRPSSTDIEIVEVKEEPKVSNQHSLSLRHSQSNTINHDSAFLPVQKSTHSPTRFSQFLIDTPSPEEQLSSIEDDRSASPSVNNDETNSKSTRINRRQYNFLIELPDQQSLNSFIETTASESNSRWTWRRTSANSRGYKIYYVCNYSMRRHFHPCPAAMYALFNTSGSISIYSHGQHRHIPKNQDPSTITEQTKEEIFKCLHLNMSSTDIREHLIRLKLPFGDAKKLNNFIKYHKEILRFGAVTNVRLYGSAYRQPHCWAIRRPSPNDAANPTTN